MEPCLDDASIPSIRYNFCPIDKISACEKDNTIDVIGVVKDSGDLIEFVARSSGKPMKKRDIVLVDMTNAAVTITLWGNDAQSFDGTMNPVLAIKGARVSDYNGKTLSVSMSSTLTLNPDIPEAHQLRGW